MRFCPSRSTAICLMLAGAVQASSQIPGGVCGPVVRVSRGTLSPLLVRKVTPDYGAVVRQTGINGAVTFRALIGCDGHVRAVTIVSGPEVLRQATVDAVKQWVYRPYLIDGRPVAVEVTEGISMNFGADILYEAVSPGRVRVSSGVMAGRVVYKEAPVLPPLPAHSKLSGGTVLHAVIGRDGRVTELTSVSGPEPIRASVMDAVRQWRYEPFLVDGKPVEVETTITLNIDFGN